MMPYVPVTHLDSGGHAKCGRGVVLTADPAAVTCKTCSGTRRHTVSSGWQRADVRPCGTPAAYRRHKRRGERPCESCRQAESRRKADLRRAS